MINSKEGWNYNIKNSLISRGAIKNSLISRGAVKTLGLPSAHHFFNIF